MLLVKTCLDCSTIHGVGVFADEFIKKGTIAWEFHPQIDIILLPDQVTALPEAARQFIENVATPFPFDADNYCISLDNSNYINHSFTPNLITLNQGTDAVDVAFEDIEKGTELTYDYYEIDHRTATEGL
jgi:uncharacterized protein